MPKPRDDGDGLMDCEDPVVRLVLNATWSANLDLNSAVGRAVFRGDLNSTGSSVLASACGGGGGLGDVSVDCPQ